LPPHVAGVLDRLSMGIARAVARLEAHRAGQVATQVQH
jgi:hypothetical protein